MRHYYFVEESTGEEFIVGADSLVDAMVAAMDIAYDIAKHYDEEPSLSYKYEMTDDEAEASGLDEY